MTDRVQPALRVIGDDLSGTAGVGAELAAAGVRARLVSDLDTVAALLAWAGPHKAALVSMESRELTPAAARAAAQRAAAAVTDDRSVLLKKHDSLLRGHPATELAGVLDGAGVDAALCLFAAPAHGRVTIDGQQYLRGVDGTGTTHVGDALAEVRAVFGARMGHLPLRTAGDLASTVPPLRAELSEGRRVIVADADDEAHLDVAIAAALRCGIRVIAGASGIGRAAVRAVQAMHARALVVSGTKSAPGHRQLAALARANVSVHPLPPRPSTDAAKDIVAAASAALTAGRSTAISAPEAEVAAGVTDALAATTAAVLDIVSPRLLVLVGGKTAAAVTERLGSRALGIDGEHIPGVTDAHLEDGPHAGLRVAIKPGAYGADDTLYRVVDAVDIPASAPPADPISTTTEGTTT